MPGKMGNGTVRIQTEDSHMDNLLNTCLFGMINSYFRLQHHRKIVSCQEKKPVNPFKRLLIGCKVIEVKKAGVLKTAGKLRQLLFFLEVTERLTE